MTKIDAQAARPAASSIQETKPQIKTDVVGRLIGRVVRVLDSHFAMPPSIKALFPESKIEQSHNLNTALKPPQEHSGSNRIDSVQVRQVSDESTDQANSPDIKADLIALVDKARRLERSLQTALSEGAHSNGPGTLFANRFDLRFLSPDLLVGIAARLQEVGGEAPDWAPKNDRMGDELKDALVKVAKHAETSIVKSVMERLPADATQADYDALFDVEKTQLRHYDFGGNRFVKDFALGYLPSNLTESQEVEVGDWLNTVSKIRSELGETRDQISVLAKLTEGQGSTIEDQLSASPSEYEAVTQHAVLRGERTMHQDLRPEQSAQEPLPYETPVSMSIESLYESIVSEDNESALASEIKQTPDSNEK